MFDYDSDMDQCYICGEIFKKSFNLERCPGCRARITHNNPVKKVPKQEPKIEQNFEQKDNAEEEYLKDLEFKRQEEMNKINNDYNEIFFLLDSYGNNKNMSLKDLKPKFQLMNKKLYEKRNGKLEAPICAVCLKKIKSGTMIYLLACKHILHKPCADDWFKTKTECPYCRRYVYFIAK